MMWLLASLALLLLGAVVSLLKGYGAGYRGLIPPYIVLTEPQGRFDEAGFLGSPGFLEADRGEGERKMAG